MGDEINLGAPVGSPVRDYIPTNRSWIAKQEPRKEAQAAVLVRNVGDEAELCLAANLMRAT
jgi:hypothetical protein